MFSEKTRTLRKDLALCLGTLIYWYYYSSSRHYCVIDKYRSCELINMTLDLIKKLLLDSINGKAPVTLACLNGYFIVTS